MPRVRPDRAPPRRLPSLQQPAVASGSSVSTFRTKVGSDNAGGRSAPPARGPISSDRSLRTVATVATEESSSFQLPGHPHSIDFAATEEDFENDDDGGHGHVPPEHVPSSPVPPAGAPASGKPLQRSDFSAQGWATAVPRYFFLLAVQAGCLFAGLELLQRGWPLEKRAASKLPASLARVAYAVILALSSAPMGVGLLSYAFRIRRKYRNLYMIIFAAMLTVAWVFLLFDWENDTDSETRALRSVGIVTWHFVVLALPALLSTRHEKRRGAGTGKPVFKHMYIIAGSLSMLSGVVGVWSDGGGSVFFACVIVWLLFSFTYAMFQDQPPAIALDVWYLASVIASVNVTPVLVANLLVLFEDLGAPPLLGGVIVTVCMSWLHVILRALGARALPLRFRSIALFPLQVFEDIIVDTLFFKVAPFGDTFFLLVLLQVWRTIGRDAGLYDEVRHYCKQGIRWVFGLESQQRDTDLPEQVRIWLQNLISETSSTVAVMVLLGVEGTLAGKDLGVVTELDTDERQDLLLGYVFLLGIDLAVHLGIGLFMRQRIRFLRKQNEVEAAHEDDPEYPSSKAAIRIVGRSDLSIGVEAGLLARHHGMLILGTCVFMLMTATELVRMQLVDYD